MDMETNEKFFKKITSRKKLKKEAKRVVKEHLRVEDSIVFNRELKRWANKHLRLGKYDLILWEQLRSKVNREYSGKRNDND